MALVQKYKIRKRPRRESSDDYSVEEISPDDMGYDGDIEVLRPDQYEEPDSDIEDDHALRRLWPDTDDELASRFSKLRRLSSERQPRTDRQDHVDRGRKRLSREMDDEEEGPPVGHTEIEVSELVDGQAEQPPLKRRKKRSGQTPLGRRVVKKQAHEAWTDTSDETEDAAIESPNSRLSTPEPPNSPLTTLLSNEGSRGQGDLDAMEIG